MASEDTRIPPIMSIPREVRAIIYRKVAAISASQRNILKLRLVCQQWRNEIDDFCDFSATIDDRKQSLETIQRISQLRLKSCTLNHLTKESITSFSLKQPSLLKILKVPLPSVESTVVDSILNSCESLIELQISFPLQSDDNTSENISSKQIRLFNLRKLSISFSSLPSPTTNENFFVHPTRDLVRHSQTLLKILSPPSPHLESFKLDLRCLGFAQMSSFTGIILSFIAERWASLRSLSLELIQGNHGIPMISQPLASKDLDQINLTNLKKCINLKKFRIINSSSIGIELFTQLLSQQGNLHFVETDILPAPMSLYSQMICKNRHTLVSVDIGDMTIDLDEQGPFDMSVFQHCSSLKRLTLDRNCLHRRVFEDEANNMAAGGVGAELINLFSLPPSLEELALNYFLVLSDEFLIYFNNKEECRLISLSLTQCGDFGEFGVDGSVLEAIITLIDIEMIEISKLNFSSSEERLKLNLILNAFGYENDHAYFQLVKRGSDLEDPESSEFYHSLDDLEI